MIYTSHGWATFDMQCYSFVSILSGLYSKMQCAVDKQVIAEQLQHYGVTP